MGDDQTPAGISEPFKWRMGFMNSAGKFLTAEPFGFKLNVSASSLKKRQTWTIVPIDNSSVTSGQILIRSHLNRYLASDKDGRVSCNVDDSEGPACNNEECRFVLEFSVHHAGGWAFKSAAYGYYLTGNDDHIDCFSKTPVYWRPHLAIHPQVHVKNLFSQRYLRLTENEIRGDQTLPWGHNSLITMEHRAGLIAVRTSDNRYLLSDGSLTDKVASTAPPSMSSNQSEDTSGLYHLEIRTVGNSTGLAFQDQLGRYLSLIGNKATMKAKNRSVTRDDLFVLEDSYAQVAVLAHNGKFASVRQGVDLYANQSEVEESEIFQLEFQPQTKMWRIRSNNGKLWSVDPGTSGIKSTGNEKDTKTLFHLDYTSNEDACVGIRADCNNQYVTSRKLGVIAASGSSSVDSHTAGLNNGNGHAAAGDVEIAASATNVALKQEEKFYLVLLNRPMLVLRCEYGSIGGRNMRVDCNMVNYQAFRLEHIGEGKYSLTSEDEKSCWAVSSETGSPLQLVNKTSDLSHNSAHTFALRFLNRTQLAIRSCFNGKYLRGEQNGTIKADSAEYGQVSTLWEY